MFRSQMMLVVACVLKWMLYHFSVWCDAVCRLQPASWKHWSSILILLRVARKVAAQFHQSMYLICCSFTLHYRSSFFPFTAAVIMH